jgi:hypothetical protein
MYNMVNEQGKEAVMYDLNCSELSTLHQEAIRRDAAIACLLSGCRQSKLSLRTRLLPALGDLLIQTGQRLKEAPRRLETETASLSSLTILL